MAATNKDLPGLVRKEAFREDLYFRLNVLTIDLPPLRERGDDVLMLVQHFSSLFAAESGKPIPRFSDQALQVLRDYRWPGNVRELENVVQRLMVMTEGDLVDVPDLPSLMRFSALGRRRIRPDPGPGRSRVHPQCPGKRRRQPDAGSRDTRDRPQDAARETQEPQTARGLIAAGEFLPTGTKLPSARIHVETRTYSCQRIKELLI